MSMKKKIYLLTTTLVSFTLIIVLSISTYSLWNQMLHDKYENAASIATLLDESLEGTYDNQLINKNTSNELTKKELNKRLQPFIDQITKSYPGYGAGYYVKDLDSIVAFGPNFNEEGLKDIAPDSLARTVYKTKKPYEFHSYSQTRDGIVVANMRPIIRNGEVIGHVWGNVLMDDVYAFFLKDIDKMIALFLGMLLITFVGSHMITNQYIKNLRDFRERVRNLDLNKQQAPTFSVELMEVYNEVVTSRNALVENEKRFRDVVTAFDEFVWEVDNNGTYIFLSERVTSHLGYTPDELLGKKTFETMLDEDKENAKQMFEEHVMNETPFRDLEYRKKKKNGESVYLSTTSIPIFDNEGQLLGFRGATRNITIQKKHEAEIQYLAYYDQLTSLPNRTLLRKEIDELVHNKKQFAILFIDLDQFKQVNDSLGHSTGDKLLQILSSRLKECIQADEKVFRFGGDEFIVLLKDFANVEEIKIRSQHIINHVSKPVPLNKIQLFITPSIGISIYPTHGTHIESLIKNADMAMYKAKTNGRKQCILYTEDLGNHVIENFELANEMNEAIAKEQFLLNYQPQVNVDTGEIVGVEALIRWHHPTKGIISPATFIPIAEETGLIIQLGKWILKRACLDRKQWLDQGVKDIRVAVNISIIQFQQDDFVDCVKNILNEVGLDSKFLELEITESIAMDNHEKVIKKLQTLKENNIFISIDDFGMGYSSLNYLKQLPIDQLKIDRSFIKDIIETNDVSIIQSIVSMAQSMCLSVVAEGIEYPGQVSILKSLDCTIAQGFLYYRPMKEIDLIDVLKSNEVSLLYK